VGPRAVLDAVVKRKFPAPSGNRILEHRSSSPQPSAIPTELSWLFIIIISHTLTKVEKCTPLEYTFFLNALFVILNISLALLSIYY
jgi:hypothetical protein